MKFQFDELSEKSNLSSNKKNLYYNKINLFYFKKSFLSVIYNNKGLILMVFVIFLLLFKLNEKILYLKNENLKLQNQNSNIIEEIKNKIISVNKTINNMEFKRNKKIDKIEKTFNLINYKKSEIFNINSIIKDNLGQKNPEIIKFLNSTFLKGKNIIHISYSADSNYIFPLLVSITSVLTNSETSTFIVFHVFTTFYGNFKNLFKILIELEKDYKNTKFFCYDMKNAFYKDKKNRWGPTALYRIVFPKILSIIDKTIFLDPDTLTFKDLNLLYNIDMKDKYILGSIDPGLKRTDKFYNTTLYICSGVILMNLKKIREDNLSNLLIEQYFDMRPKLKFVDQDLLNYFFYPNIGLLPYKYGIFNYYNFKEFIEKIIPKIRYNINIKEMKEAFLDPSIVHYVMCSRKPWKKKAFRLIENKKYKIECKKEKELWYSYAKKTRYYSEINEKYNN